LIQTGSKPDRLLQHFINIVHRDFSQKIFVMIYGKAGGGKSTLLNIPANLYGDDLTSATDIYRMGRKFGLEDCYDKRINVDSDMPTKKMSPDIVATLKKITGGVHGSDNKMVVEKKGVGIFSVHIHCFFLFGCNQLAKWEEDSLQEVESIMRRALLVKYESFAIDCAGLEEITLDPEFLDKIYTWLLHQPVAPVKNIDKASWVKETQKEWFLDCDPLMGVLNDLYESSDSDKDTVPCREVYDKALAELQDQNLTIPKNLMAQITISLMAMGVRKNTTKNNPKYLRIKRQYILDGSEDDPKNPYEEMGVIPNRGGSA
jgi:phage/plasmid-associated DNA primase